MTDGQLGKTERRSACGEAGAKSPGTSRDGGELEEEWGSDEMEYSDRT